MDENTTADEKGEMAGSHMPILLGDDVDDHDYMVADRTTRRDGLENMAMAMCG